MKRIISIALALVLVFTCIPVFAVEPVAPTEDIQTFSASDLPVQVLDYVRKYGIEVNEDSKFIFQSTTDRTRTTPTSTVLQVITQNENRIESNMMISFTTEDDGTTHPDTSLNQLKCKTRDSSELPFIKDDVGFKVICKCVYDVYQEGWGSTYIHLIGEYFTYYNLGGTAPSKILEVTSANGDLYNISGNNVTLVKEMYRYEIDYTKYNPVSNNLCGITQEMPANEYVLPFGALGGLAMGCFITVSGEEYVFERTVR